MNEEVYKGNSTLIAFSADDRTTEREVEHYKTIPVQKEKGRLPPSDESDLMQKKKR